MCCLTLYLYNVKFLSKPIVFIEVSMVQWLAESFVTQAFRVRFSLGEEVLTFLCRFTHFPQILQILQTFAWPPGFQATIGKTGLLPLILDCIENSKSLSKPMAHSEPKSIFWHENTKID